MGRQRCPKRHHHQNSLTLLGTFLGPKIIKSRFQRHPKTSSEICLEKVFLKGVILRSSTCLNCVRGLKNQGFDVFRKGPKNEPNRHPFWHHFWIKYDQKWTRKGFQKILQKRVPPKTQTSPCLQAGRLLETTPRVRIFNNKNNSLDNNSSNYSNNCKNYCSCSVSVRSCCLNSVICPSVCSTSD